MFLGIRCFSNILASEVVGDRNHGGSLRFLVLSPSEKFGQPANYLKSGAVFG